MDRGVLKAYAISFRKGSLRAFEHCSSVRVCLVSSSSQYLFGRLIVVMKLGHGSLLVEDDSSL